MVEFAFHRAGNVGILTFAGRLTLETEAKLREVLMMSLENADYVLVNFTDVVAVDDLCLRVFCSAHRVSMRYNRRFEVIGIGPEVLKRESGKCGGLCRPGVEPDCSENCFWQKDPCRMHEGTWRRREEDSSLSRVLTDGGSPKRGFLNRSGDHHEI